VLSNCCNHLTQVSKSSFVFGVGFNILAHTSSTVLVLESFIFQTPSEISFVVHINANVHTKASNSACFSFGNLLLKSSSQGSLFINSPHFQIQVANVHNIFAHHSV
jgi:hypothetical protein